MKKIMGMAKWEKELDILIREPINKNEIQVKLRALSERHTQSYIGVVGKYLNQVDENNRESLFYEVFFDDYLKDRPNVIPYIVFRSEGLNDLLFIDQNKSPEEKTDFSYRVSNIFYRSRTDMPLLIVGETGTSKNLISRAIHKMSTRRGIKLVEINFVSFPENLIENELFGHKKGAFTGANSDKDGFLKAADKGTLILDELGKMPKFLQAKLLRAIEEKEFYPVGSTEPINIDLRFIATAQPSDLEKESILPDLLYRLGYPDIIEMPTLNERIDELKKFQNQYIMMGPVLERIIKSEFKGLIPDEFFISKEIYDILFSHHYKGNFRELANILRAAILSAIAEGRKAILPKDLYLIKEDSKMSSCKKDNSNTVYKTNLEDIKLKDIIAYSNKIRASIVEKKINEVLSGGKNIKSVVIKEGLSPEKYQNFWKQVRTITGKKIKELNK